MADPMTLGELIAALENADLNLTVQDGIDTPHSYRGYYEQLAFEPATGVTVAQMLANAREALGATYEGYKGGEYTMREDTVCWIATWGACGVELTTERLRDMLAAGRGQDGQAAADPLTPERLTEIRQRADGATAGPWKAQDRTLYVVAPGHVHIADFEWLADTQEEWDEFQRNTVFVAAARQDVPALLAEVERLRAELADAREEERRQRETAEAASRGWRNEVAEVDHLRRTVAGWRDSYERLSRQVLRRHHAWQSARRGRKQARKRLGDALGALYWVEYQLSKHVDYGGDIEDAHDTARDAYRRLTGGTGGGQ